MSPDVPRLFSTLYTSTSSTAVSSVHDGNASRLNAVYASKFLSRSYEFAGLLPTVSRLLCALYDHHATRADVKAFEHDDRMRIGDLDSATLGDLADVRTQIDVLNGTVDEAMTDELASLKALGWGVDSSALMPLIAMTGDQIQSLASGDLVRLLPRSWIA